VPDNAKIKFRYIVPFLNPKTCGIYKDGKPRYKVDAATGEKSATEIDNELIEAVDLFTAGRKGSSQFDVSADDVFRKGVIVPAYFDTRFNLPIERLLKTLHVSGITIGELVDRHIVSVRAGHGSPGNDQRTGTVPYIKVSDIRALRMNINPTNMIPQKVAEEFWRGKTSGLEAWDILTPNRASSNIGEFAIIMPGEEQVVLTKEMFVLRVLGGGVIDPFYLFWALCLKAVREQWRRIVLMQTNREDCGDRYREIIIPKPPSLKWAKERAEAFRAYFSVVAEAKKDFLKSIRESSIPLIASASGAPQQDDV